VRGDAWEGISAYAVHLHTKRSAKRNVKDLGPNPKYKTPETLESYKKKRDFSKSAEPGAEESIAIMQPGFIMIFALNKMAHSNPGLFQEGCLQDQE